MPTKSETNPTSIRLTPLAMTLWQEIADEMGANKTSTLEIIIREKATALGIKPTPQTPPKSSSKP